MKSSAAFVAVFSLFLISSSGAPITRSKAKAQQAAHTSTSNVGPSSGSTHVPNTPPPPQPFGKNTGALVSINTNPATGGKVNKDTVGQEAVAGYQNIDAHTSKSTHPITSTAVMPGTEAYPDGVAISVSKPTGSTQPRKDGTTQNEERAQNVKAQAEKYDPLTAEVLQQREKNAPVSTGSKPQALPEQNDLSREHAEDVNNIASAKQGQQQGFPGVIPGTQAAAAGDTSMGNGKSKEGATLVDACGTAQDGKQKIDPSCFQVSENRKQQGPPGIEMIPAKEIPQPVHDQMAAKKAAKEKQG
ncbi:hypothetical protein KVT40_002166 [Elsinoe batatas]|uniref:Uncharacterized protein n=1 Tax=Elsinoe batatas TaxID=2601811 RepID=A0A8K0L7C4_9PEZI|nr:hypothetical protein KVT40_002166 [Elsinoe batatas]